MLYEDKDRQSIEGTDFLKKSDKQKDLMKADYDKLISNFGPEYSKFSFKEFCNNRLIVASRIFGFTQNGEKEDALIPYGDLINPGIKKVSWVYDDNKNCFVFTAIMNISKGESIEISFGKKCNTRFLTNYGFIKDNNFLDNEIEISIFDLCLAKKENLLFKKKNELVKLEGDGYFNFTLSANKNQFFEVFRQIRIGLVENENELLRVVEKKKSTVSLEKKIISLIQNAISKRIQTYPTSYEGDKKLMENKDLNINEINCILARLGEKEILNFFQNFFYFLGENISYFSINEEVDFDIYEVYYESFLEKQEK